MKAVRYAAVAAIATTLMACVSPRAVSPPHVITAAPVQAPAQLIALSDFDAAQVALPGFELQRDASGKAADAEASVVRNLTFATDSSIMSSHDVTRLAQLQVYLAANPNVDVRIEGYGDVLSSNERFQDLSLDRAHAVARALLANMRVNNVIVAVAGARRDQQKNAGLANITFLWPTAVPSLNAPN
jgi:outer membrane protein OmpA-like peptidoglycan-associated protein